MEKTTETKSATIYVPVAGSAYAMSIDAASGIVGTPVGDMCLIHMEGNRYDASNLRTYRERISHAAGRLFTNYPTIAKMGVQQADLNNNFIAVGTIREKTEAEKKARENAMSASYVSRLSEQERNHLAAHWEETIAYYVISFDSPEIAAAYGGSIG